MLETGAKPERADATGPYAPGHSGCRGGPCPASFTLRPWWSEPHCLGRLYDSASIAALAWPCCAEPSKDKHDPAAYAAIKRSEPGAQQRQDCTAAARQTGAPVSLLPSQHPSGRETGFKGTDATGSASTRKPGSGVQGLGFGVQGLGFRVARCSGSIPEQRCFLWQRGCQAPKRDAIGNSRRRSQNPALHLAHVPQTHRSDVRHIHVELRVIFEHSRTSCI